MNWIELFKALPFLRKASPVLVGLIAVCYSPLPKLFSAFRAPFPEIVAGNQSPYFRIYDEIKKLRKPTFILNSHCYGDDIPKMYLKYIGDEIQPPSLVMDSMGCRDGEVRVRNELQKFMRAHEDAVLVLDQKQSECSEDLPVGVTRSKHSKCVWLVEKPKSLMQIKEVVQQMKFVSRGTLFDLKTAD